MAPEPVAGKRPLTFAGVEAAPGRSSFPVRSARTVISRAIDSIAPFRVGSAVAVRGKAIGMRVLYYDPYTPDGYDKALGVTRAETLDELLVQSDVMTCHCPLTDETRHMVNAAAIAKLKRGSYLVNNARRDVVNTAAITNNITSDQLNNANIDVLETEPTPHEHTLITT